MDSKINLNVLCHTFLNEKTHAVTIHFIKSYSRLNAVNNQIIWLSEIDGDLYHVDRDAKKYMNSSPPLIKIY